MEATLGKPNSGRHPAKAAAEDIWSMALTLAASSLAQQTKDRFSLNPAADLFTDGLGKLGENVLKYNNQYTQGIYHAEEDEGDHPPFLEIDGIISLPASPILGATVATLPTLPTLPTLSEGFEGNEPV